MPWCQMSSYSKKYFLVSGLLNLVALTFLAFLVAVAVCLLYEFLVILIIINLQKTVEPKNASNYLTL